MSPEQALALVNAFDAIPDGSKHAALMGLIERLADRNAAQFFKVATERIQPEWAKDCAGGVQ